MAEIALLVATILAGPVVASDAAEPGLLRETSTERLTTPNPYGDSTSAMFSVWCQVYGCLGIYDWDKKQWAGMLAERWEVVNPTTWRFHLRQDLKRQDGGPGVTAKDVVFTLDRIKTDPDSQQKYLLNGIDSATEVDEHTVDIHTTAPDAPLLSFIFERLIITSADLFKQYGKDADTKAPWGWGPYKLDEFSIDQRVVLSRNDAYPGLDPATPKRVIIQMMQEAEQRVTAILNGEVEIARLIPPQLMPRLEGRKDIKVVTTGAIELMFLGMNNKIKPWDDVRVRQAVGHAVDRDLIIKKLLGDKAEHLNGPIGSTQLCWNGGMPAANVYDPALSKKLLAEAGYKDGGPEVDLVTPTNRYISDRQSAEVITQMLQKVGFKVKLQTPEYANMWASIRTGKTGFFYFGRGSVIDPMEAMSQYFETGVTPRIAYSNPAFDALIADIRKEFDDTKRCDLVRQAAKIVTDDAPAVFLWSHKLDNGVRQDVTFRPDPTGEIWFPTVRMK